MSEDAKRLATVDPIREDRTAAWSAKAAAGDALQRVDHKAPIACVWLDNGRLKWSIANTDMQSLSVFAAALMDMAQHDIRANIAQQ